MSAERLRAAAALMRERAEDATASPWVKKRGPGEHVYGELGHTFVADTASRQDMRHIASWHPAVALAVADLLEVVASGHLFGEQWASQSWSAMCTSHAALAVADTYLGATP